MTPNSVLSNPVGPSNPRVVILYGSQTGVSESVASRLVLQARHLFAANYNNSHSSCLSIALQYFNAYTPISRLSQEDCVFVFVCSTTGYGVPPDNMLSFWNRIMHRSLPVGRTLPHSLRFAVLGIGDSSYPKFNVVAKKLYRRLVQLGASPLEIPSAPGELTTPGLGLADEQSEMGLNGLFSWWFPLLWMQLSSHLKLSFVVDVEKPLSLAFLESPSVISSYWPVYRVSRVGSPPAKSPNDTRVAEQLNPLIEKQCRITGDSNFKPNFCQLFRVVQNVRLTPITHFQDTRLIKLCPEPCATNPGMQFRPGDVLFVQPPNSNVHVTTLFQLTGVSPDESVCVTELDCKFPIPVNRMLTAVPQLTAMWLATYYFDLNAVPNPVMFANLATVAHLTLRNSCTDPSSVDLERLQLEYGRLQELGIVTSPDTADDFYEYVTRPRRVVVEVLTDFPVTSSLLSLSRWFDVLPGPIRARPYSIASAPLDLEILVAVVRYRTRLTAPREGLASVYLSKLQPGDVLSGWIASGITGGFDFTPSLNVPVSPCLFIATGTSVAPFRSFLLHQRMILGEQRVYNVMVFGCRYADRDFYFESDWRDLERTGQLLLIPAFSRVHTDASSSKGRVYVQHKLREYSDIVWSILSDPNARVFVCGGAKSLPGEVRESLAYVCQTSGQCSASDAESRIAELESSGRFQVEAWG